MHGTYAQNSLGDLAEVSNLPDNMPKLKHWTSLMLNHFFIGDLQTSSSARGDATFISFKLKGGDQSFVLPATGGMVVNFKQKGASKNPWLASTGTFSINYKRELLAYTRLALTDFRQGDNFFDFKLGVDVIKVNDAQMVAHTLNYFVEAENTAGKFEVMRKQLNARMKLNMPAPPVKDDLQAFMIVLRKHFNGEALKDAIYKTYILGKTQKETDKNLYSFFGRTSGPFVDYAVPARLSQLNDPYFELKTETPEQLRIPYALVRMQSKVGDSVFKYDYQYLVGRFKLAERKLDLTFKGSHLRGVPRAQLKVWAHDPKLGAAWKPATILGKDDVQFTQLLLSLSEDKIELKGYDFMDAEYLIATMPWPKDFVKTTMMDWKK